MQLAQKNTGNYLVTLHRDDEEFYLRVVYLGKWSSGDATDISLLPDTSGNMKKKFRSRIKGDLDVTDRLVEAGYDQYGNQIRLLHMVNL